MTDQLKGAAITFQWGEEQQRSFDKLKVALATAPILAIVDPQKPFVVETDASAKAVGVVLIQDGHLVAYESKKLNRAQQKTQLTSVSYLPSYTPYVNGNITYMVHNLR